MSISLHRVSAAFAAVVIGGLLSPMLQTDPLYRVNVYTFIIYFIHAIGLYGSVCAIDARQLRAQWKIVLAALTIGIAGKILLIGTAMSVVIGGVLAFAIATIMTQIDPILVSSEIENTRKSYSESVSTFLRSWSALDNPVTAVIALYLLSLSTTPGAVHATSGAFLLPFIVDIGRNLALFVLVWALKWIFCRLDWNYLLLLIVAVPAAAHWQLMLGISLVGFIIRPTSTVIITRAVDAALYFSLALLGLVLAKTATYGSLATATLLAGATFLAQVLLGAVFLSRLHAPDRWRVLLAQQNGITSITLALIFEPFYPGTVAVVGPAVFMINFLHIIANVLASRLKFPMT